LSLQLFDRISEIEGKVEDILYNIGQGIAHTGLDITKLMQSYGYNLEEEKIQNENLIVDVNESVNRSMMFMN
jgi:hypothetical protein